MLRNGLVKWLRQTISVCFFVIFSFNFFMNVDVRADVIPIQVNFTNDVHSQARPTLGQKHESPQKLGGIARLQTLFRSIRERNPVALILDAGDWSDGSIHYVGLDGTASLRMMDLLGYHGKVPAWINTDHLAVNPEGDPVDHGYDVIAVGNHDFLNGPNELLRTFSVVRPSTPFLAGNVDTSGYEHAAEFHEWIKPYMIKTVNGVRVAILGVTTFELIYDRFLRPIKILEPFRWTRNTASMLKENGQADVVIALSHNSVRANKWLAKFAPAVDLVIASHDHKLLTQPEVVTGWPRKTPAWVVEAGSWGHYVGQVGLEFDTETRRVESTTYKLIPVDAQWDEDPEALALIERVEKSVVEKRGDVFSRVAWASDMEIPRYGFDSPAARLATAAFLEETGAECALESREFVAAGLPRGEIPSSAFFNIIPSIYNPKRNETSTVQVLSIRGSTIANFFRTVFSTSALGSFGLLSFANMSIVFDPWFKPTSEVDHSWGITKFFQSLSNTYRAGVFGVKDILINNRPLQMDREYRVAMQDSFLLAIQFVNKYLEIVDFRRARQESTGKEAWRVVQDYVNRHSPAEIESQLFSPQIRTVRPDLTVFQHWVQASRVRQVGQSVKATFVVQVQNLGLAAVSEVDGDLMPKMRLIVREKEHVADRTVGEIEVGKPKMLLPLGPNEKQTLVWNEVRLPLEPDRTYAVTVQIMGAHGITAHSGSETTRWFSLDPEVL